MNVFLVIDDDETFCRVLQRALVRRGLVAHTAHTAEDALQQLQAHAVTHVVLDLKLAETTGLQLLPQLLARRPAPRVVMLTGYASVATTVDAIRQGAHHYLCKPASVDEILAAFDDVVPAASAPPEAARPLSVERLEWEYIQRQLQAHDGNIAATARALGMHRRTLQRKLGKRPVKS